MLFQCVTEQKNEVDCYLKKKVLDKKSNHEGHQIQTQKDITLTHCFLSEKYDLNGKSVRSWYFSEPVLYGVVNSVKSRSKVEEIQTSDTPFRHSFNMSFIYYLFSRAKHCCTSYIIK